MHAFFQAKRLLLYFFKPRGCVVRVLASCQTTTKARRRLVSCSSLHVCMLYVLCGGLQCRRGYSSCPVFMSPLECLFVLKILSRTQQATEVEKSMGCSLKPLHCGDTALPPLKAIHTVGHFPTESAHVHYRKGP